MPKPERGSLTTLLTKKALGHGAPAAMPLDEAETAVFGTDAVAPPELVQSSVRTTVPPTVPPTFVHTDVRTGVQPDLQPTTLLNRNRKRTVRVPWTFKMPFELREELEAVARFNELNMTEIAVEAIERHLPHFPHPPGKQRRAGESE